MISQVKFEEAFMMLEACEKGLNVIGYIPVIGTVGAGCRDYLAKIEIIAGIVFGAVAIGLHVQKNPSHAFTVISAALIGHGLLNQVRARFEYIPGVALVTTLPYDLLAAHYVGGRLFSYVSGIGSVDVISQLLKGSV